MGDDDCDLFHEQLMEVASPRVLLDKTQGRLSG